MTPEELVRLREEAAEFLRLVQQLDGFSARRAELAPPPLALKWPFRTIRRLLSWPDDPIERDEAQTAPGTGLLDRNEDGDLIQAPRPDADQLEALAEYEHRLAVFAHQYLAGTQWGARATHRALQRDEPIK